MRKNKILLLGMLVVCLASYSKDETVSIERSANIVIDTPNGKAAERIYFDVTTGALQLTKDPTNLGLYFKFGSVVGVATGNNGDDFDPTDVVFNPATIAITGWGNSFNGVFYPYSVPSYSSDDWNAGRKNVSDADYHTINNLKAGKGDPCKLVGYTIEQIKTMLANNQLPDNKKWRLPTTAENATFVGSSSSYSDTEDWGTISNVKGRFFPKGSGNTGTTGVFLPAAGCRGYSDGAIYDVGTDGGYWPSTANGSSTGYCLTFFSDGFVYPQNVYSILSCGYPVRCVSQLAS